MKAGRIEPGVLAFDADGLPRSPAFDDRYHPRAGAWAQARHVFLGGNQLPARWAGRDRFVIVETGFGLGHNFLATWGAWRADGHRPGRLWFVSIEKHPLSRADLQAVHADSPEPALSRALVAAWPPLVANWHNLAFEGGRVMLLLAFGDVADAVPGLVVQADALFLDGFAPARNPQMWEARMLKALAHRCAPGASAATWSVARTTVEGLQSAGFTVDRAPGLASRPAMTVARFGQRYTPRQPAARPPLPARARHERRCAIVGAGLAGAATAWALARDGWQCTVFDRHAMPAAEASGNAGGLFHGVVHAGDGLHARAFRAAALEAERTYRPLVADGTVPGQVQGLLRTETALDAPAMRALLDRLGLPPDYVQALDADAASARAGHRLRGPAWWYPGGGWLDPAALVRHWLGAPGVHFAGRHDIADVRAEGDGWQLLDPAGRIVADVPVVVLAHGRAAAAQVPGTQGHLQWQRGQVTLLPAQTAGWQAPRVPLGGAGYALTLADGRVLCGATTSPDDDDPRVRNADHAHNLERLGRLGLRDHAQPAGSTALPPGLQGRVGWRLGTADRLPLVGAVPVGGSTATRVAHAVRRPGLYACTGFGGRGITWAALAGQLAAAWVTRCPFPLEAALVDALDPARFMVRARQRHAAG